MSARTCFHGRHLKPIILDGLNGENWRLRDYEERGGYSALRTEGLSLTRAAEAVGYRSMIVATTLAAS